MAVPERELEEPEVEEGGLDSELPVVIMVDLEDPVPTIEAPVPTSVTLAAREVAEPLTGVTKVEFWPAGTTAAEAWEVAAAG